MKFFVARVCNPCFWRRQHGLKTRATQKFTRSQHGRSRDRLGYRAIALFPDGHVPTDQTERRRVLNRLPEDVQWDRLGELTTEFYDTGEALALLVEDFVASHRELFPALHQ